MKSTLTIFLVFFAFALFAVPGANRGFAHCQIPCGIYDDELRLEMIAEHITTVEKSMRQITELSKQTDMNMNQIVRWIENKEKHADEIQHIVTQYFMAQRIKPSAGNDIQATKDYQRKLSLLHELLIYAMKAKQTTDPAHVEKLRSLLDEFRSTYLGPEGHEH